MKRLPLAALLALAAACSDDPAGPDSTFNVDILLDAGPTEQQILEVGAELQLSATVSDDQGAPVQDPRVTWRSTNAAVATVDTVGLVRAVSPGSALVIASAEGAADTVSLTVLAAPPPGVAECAPGVPGLDLQVGEVFTTTAAQRQTLCLNGGAGGSEYAFIPFNASTVAAGRIQFEVLGGGVVPVTGPPDPSRAPTLARASAAGLDLPRRDEAFHLGMLRATEDRFDALRASRGYSPRLSRSLAAAAVPEVGDTLRLNVQTDFGCTNTDFRVAVVEAVTEHAVVVADTGNPAGGFTRDEYRSFGVTFDTLVYPVDIANFGDLPSDLDENERVLIFFTEAVNDLTEPGSGSFVGGFFFGRDLLPRSTGTDPCAGSNEAELFYLMVPDPDRAANEPAFARDRVLRGSVGVIAHEFQHLINLTRRIAGTANSGEEVWLNEGLSHIAEELVFYEASGLDPRMNIDRQTALTEPVRTPWIAYASDNFGRFLDYLQDPEEESLIGLDDELPTRGATWAFLRYAADRLESPDAQFFQALVDGPNAGLVNLQAALGSGNDAVQWMQDWTTSVYTDDAGLGVDARYQQPSWEYRTVMTAFRGIDKYPLKTIELVAGADAVGLNLKGGGAAYVRFGIAAGSRAAVRTSLDGIRIDDERLRISIVRTR